MLMTLTSKAFSSQGEIPSLYTCEDKDVSPELTWNNIPNATKSLALIVEDPDAPDPKAPKMTWVHWILYNIPADTNILSENVTVAQLPKGTLQGQNNWNRTGYGGPCPPIGKHRYFFKLYALNEVLPDLQKPNADTLRAAMEGKIIAQAELMGTYIKKAH